MNSNILVLGVGNYLMGDEGIGVHVVEKLKQQPQPGIDYLDGGTGGFHLLEYFENYQHVIIIDAMLDQEPPGTIRQLKPRFSKDFPQAMSTHDIGLKDMVSALQLLDKMSQLHLFAISINSIQQQGIELTPELEDAVDEIANAVNQLLSELASAEAELHTIIM